VIDAGYPDGARRVAAAAFVKISRYFSATPPAEWE
jgi:hypothetical protein